MKKAGTRPRSTSRFFAVSIALAAIGAIVACSSDDPKTDHTGACAALASRCHGVGTPLADECHDLGHAGDDARCGPRRDECLAACPERHEDGGDAHSSADASGADADAAAAPECITYCSCMKSSCSDEVNYPFGDESVCYAACAAFSSGERSCFQSFCTAAGAPDAGAKSHQCEHATGKLGLAECP